MGARIVPISRENTDKKNRSDSTMDEKKVSKLAEISGQDENGRYILKVTFPSKAEKFNLACDECNSNYLAFRAKESADEYFRLITRNFNLNKPNIDSPKFEIFASLCALTCEIYLKSFLYYLHPEDIQHFIRGHELYSKLYSKLPPKSKELIKNSVIEELPHVDFEKALAECDTVFEDYRYSYELNGFSISTSFLIRLLKVLNGIKFDQLK